MTKHQSILNILNLLREIGELLEETPEPSPKQLGALQAHLISAKKVISSTPKPEKQLPTDSGPIEIWSDGACSGNPGPGGWGTIIYNNGEYRELSGFSPQTTNNIMEMTGALEGIRQTPEGCSITLTTDSQYLVKGITQWIKGWKRRNWKKADGNPVMNKELWLELDKEAGLRKIQWQWVKGHAGHLQNERCDELARTEVEINTGF